MGWKLFLDDLRNPSDVWKVPDKDLVIVRTAEEAIKMVLEKGCPDFISFDHDLALDHYAPTNPMYRKPSECATGYDFANWLIAEDLRQNNKLFPEHFTWFVHSQNPVGRKNIEGLLASYFDFKKDYNRC